MGEHRRRKRLDDKELQRTVSLLRTVKSTLDPERMLGLHPFSYASEADMFSLLKAIPNPHADFCAWRKAR